MKPAVAVALFSTVLLCACDAGTALPAPDILSVSPNRIRLGNGAGRDTVKIALDAVIAVRVDYEHQRAATDALRVWIGDTEAAITNVQADGTLTVTVPESLAEGTYDVRVSLGDGREAVRTAILTITRKDTGKPDTDAGTVDSDAGILGPGGGEVPAPDAGEAPRGAELRVGDVTGFEFEALGSEQQRGVPFQVRVRAVGPRAPHFGNTGDTVVLSVNKNNGTVSPSTLSKCSAGVCSELVTLTVQGANVKLTVTDRFGAQGTTPGFKVK